MEAHKVVFVAFMITEEDVLAMHGAVILPPTLCFLDSLTFGVIIVCEWYVVFSQIIEYCFFSCHIINIHLINI